MKRKKRKQHGLLILLIAVFLAGVWFVTTSPVKAPRRMWSAAVRHVETAMPDSISLPVPDATPLGNAALPADPLPKPEAGQYAVAGVASHAFKRPEPRPMQRSEDGRPRIAIVIDDMGLSNVASEKAIALPAAVTLSFLPYGTKLEDLTGKAHDAGHEVMLHLPMEPLGYEKPGNGALLISQSSDDMREKLDKALSSFSGYDGVNNHMGSKFTADRAGMERVMEVLKEKNLFFLDSYTSSKSVGASVAQEMGVPTEIRDVFLDDTASLAAVNAQLAETERVARRKGYAIAIGHPNASTLTALKLWLPEAERMGFEIVPVRELVR